jgi:dienelactone hydrolase
MKSHGELFTRRRFLQDGSAIVTSAAIAGRTTVSGSRVAPLEDSHSFHSYQEKRREQLWGLLGDLPWNHSPGPARLVSQEEHEGYTLERLLLDLNGTEDVPAILLIPKKRAARAPGLLYIHWHGGMYELGKEQLLRGVTAQPAYAPICAEKGIVTLAIDSWCFGERKHERDGSEGEQTAFKLMLWRGQVLFGMMMFDEFRAVDYLASRPEVDATRIGALGMSMGATKAWWLTALDPRVKVCMDVCCLTDFEELIRTHGIKEHAIFYYVPSLLKSFQTADINELIVTRVRLSVNGRLDPLTPPAGVEKIRDRLMPLYAKYGKETDCRIDLFDCGHIELPVMREMILEWMGRL